MQLHPYFAQLQELAIPLAIAALIVLFSLTSFMVWSSRIRHVRHDVNELHQHISLAKHSSREALSTAQRHTQDHELQFLLRAHY